MPDDPCEKQHDKFDDAYDKWEASDKAADDAFEAAMVASGIALAACTAGLIISAGTACAIASANALHKDSVSIRASLGRDKASKDFWGKYETLKECMQKHKWYYGAISDIMP